MKSALLWIIRFCSVGVLLLPLAVDGSVIYPYSFGKVLIFQILAQVSVAAYLLLRLIDRSYRIHWKHPLVIAHGVFIAVLIVTSLAGVDGARSFWSTAQWMTGVVTYIHLFLWFVVLSAVMKTWNDWRRLIMISILVCFGAIVYGLGQSVRIEGIQLDDTSTRIYSTLGNPIYFALYVLLNLLLAIFLIIREKLFFIRIPLCFFAVISIIALFLSGTRSAVLTLGVVGFFSVPVLLLTAIKGKLRVVGFVVLGVIIATIGGIIFWLQTSEGAQWSRGHLDEGTQRIVTQMFQDPARLELSSIAMKGFYDRPIFGWGPNNYSYVFSTNVKPTDYGTLLPSKWYDQAHNQVANTLATMGFVGLLSYLSLWIVAWVLLIKRMRSEHDTRIRFALIVLSLFFFSYFFQTLTAFDTIGPLIMLYFGCALAYALTRQETERDDRVRTHFAIPLPVVMFFVALILAISVSSLGIVPYKKGQQAKKAIDLIAYDHDRGMLLFRGALSGLSFTHDDVRVNLARAALLSGQQKISRESKKEEMWFALAENEKSIVKHPLSLEYGLPLLELYRLYAEQYSDVVLPRAEELVDRLSQAYPLRRDVLYEKVFIAKQKKDFVTAGKAAQKIIELDPSRSESYWWAAQVALDDKRFNDFFTFVEQARERGYTIYQDGSTYLLLAARVDKEYLDRATRSIEEALQLMPNSPDFRAARVVLLYRGGRGNQTKEDIQWLREKSPELAKKVDVLIKQQGK